MALTNLYVFNYNNYLNRIAKKEDDLTSYGEPVYRVLNVNFTPGDGVNTVFTMGKADYDGSGDYVIECDNNETILSRWFLNHKERTRQGQWNLTLRRDVVADNYNDILNCPMIIERGMVNYSNPLVFNDEGFTFNEIKQQEILLTDTKNNFPYLVLYCAKNMEVKNDIVVKADFTTQPDIEISQPLANSIYNPDTYDGKSYNVGLELRFENLTSNREVVFNANSDGNREIRDAGPGGFYPFLSTAEAERDLSDVFNSLNQGISMTDLLSTIQASETSSLSSETETTFNNVISKGSVILRDSEGAYYRITISKSEKSNTKTLKPQDGSAYSFLNTSMITTYPTWRSNASETNVFSYPFKVDNKYYEYQVTAAPLESLDFRVNVDPTGKATTEDSECNIMLFPYGDVVTWRNGIKLRDIDKEVQLSIARAIAQKYTNSVIYDMQLLPYAPSSISRAVNNDIIDASYLSSNQYTEFEYDDIVRGVCFWCDSANFTLDIQKTLTVEKTAIDYKIDSNCNKYRLCSPNYNGIFEFNTAKNGDVDFFNIDVTYRPYNPYIHINPNFKSIYGNDFNDARGLICGGDFSLPILGDSFAQYELNNKNYINVFNRSIEHMDFNNNLANRQAGWSIATGTVSAAVQGGTTGALAGGVWGAAIGATVGGMSSLAGGLVDYKNLQDQQREDRDYTIDNFNYQLGNIKALPYSLNKVNPLTYNNKVFPFIEIYSCTDKEKQILINKIKYRSMKLNVIDTISNLKANYTEDSELHFYQGTVIMSETITKSTHELYELFEELKKGVFI